MSSVVLSGDTSGSITLSAPAVAGSNTITLPATTGTVALSADVLCVGVGQTWTSYVSGGSGSGRVANTTYTNSTGKPIQVLMSGSLSGGTCTVNGVIVSYNNGTQIYPHSFIVPNGGTYSTTSTPWNWAELR